MYKTISNYVFVGLISSFFGITFGMERERALMQLMRQDIIPVLALNDYLVPVANAYEALKREACMPYDSIEKMHQATINKINNDIRNFLSKEGAFLYTIDTEKASNKEKKHTRLSYYRTISIVCSSPPEDIHDMDIYMSINSFLYDSFHLSCKIKPYTKNDYIRKNIDIFLKNLINCYLPNGQSICVEVCSPDKISDWIIIKNLFQSKPLNNVNVDEDDEDVILMQLLLQEDSFLMGSNDDYGLLYSGMRNYEGLSHVIITAAVLVVAMVSLYF